jgi:hypothetical protein
MNTIRALKDAFNAGSFELVSASHVHDAAVLHAFPRFGQVELYAWALLKRLRIGSPESNILAVFRRT